MAKLIKKDVCLWPSHNQVGFKAGEEVRYKTEYGILAFSPMNGASGLKPDQSKSTGTAFQAWKNLPYEKDSGAERATIEVEVVEA